jgi:N-acetylglucosaminyldiphosphoundecaprenol N-acetyl-beta-D-mannosaminyltransferase
MVWYKVEISSDDAKNRRGLSLNTIEILDVKIHCTGRDEILDHAIRWAAETRQRTILYVNAHCLNKSAVDPDYREIINQADLVYPDGISIVWASRWMGGCSLEKVTGRAWIDTFCRMAAGNGIKMYILAGKPGIAEAARKKMEQNHPQIQIVGSRDGFFSKSEEESVLEEINQTKPDVLFVGMGTPFQEKWVAQHRVRIDSPVCWVVGALFDYVAGAEQPVPAWMDRYALEWLWRLSGDPKGKWRRVVIGIPEFVIRFIISRIRS